MASAALICALLPIGVASDTGLCRLLRDGVRLSVYLYFPPGKGPWPVLYEQRYADITGAGTRKALRAWQAARGLPADGYLSMDMVTRLKAQAGIA